MTPFLLLPSLALLVPSSAVQEVDGWTQFRGPGGLAVAEGESISPDLDVAKDLTWKTAVPPGSSSPCFAQGRMFLTGARGDRLFVLALDRATGELLWQRAFTGQLRRDYAHVDSSAAMPSPCTDGAHVFAYFGSYGVVALDVDGQLLWERRMKRPENDFGVGASPILAAGNLIVPRDGAEEAATLALDAATGEEVYRIQRFGFIDSYSTPFLWRNADREELIVTGTKQLCAFDPSDGKPLWNVQDVTIFTCPTPTGDETHLYYAGWSSPNASAKALIQSAFPPPFELKESDYTDTRGLFDRIDTNGDGKIEYEECPPGRGKDAFYALDPSKDGAWQFEEFNIFAGMAGTPGKNVALSVRAGGSGDVTKTHVEWTWTRGIPYVASPLLHRDRLWLVKAGGIVSTLEASTGSRVIDRERLPVGGEYYMSPVAVGDHVLVGAVTGEMYVLDATDELSIAGTLEFGDRLLATPAVIDGRMYVRTENAVWAF